ncbi:hypothetical protein AC578_6518 [Pseudocercospora eumusae]|uniref:Uncharacterized protein n=1 Tax=Pseudocercospora eumusae TaxID=321146 RepID=A0A139HHM9_9PEZI|nr:hypothetical protein AC578_6518 [Pseudocercospora eumusae]
MPQPHTFGATRAAKAALLAGEEAATAPRRRPVKTTGQFKHLEAGTLRKPKKPARPSLRDRLRKVVDKFRFRRPKQKAASPEPQPGLLQAPVLNGIATIKLAEARARVKADTTRRVVRFA